MARYQEKKLFKAPEEVKQPVISLNEYLAKHNGQRVLDKIIKKWYFKRDSTNPRKTISEWGNIIEGFHNETER